MKVEPFWWRYVSHYNSETPAWPEAGAAFDVAIVGGGLAGMVAALTLSRSGMRVAIFDKHRMGMGAAARNGGAVNPGTNVGKRLDGSRLRLGEEEARELRRFGIDAYHYLQEFLHEQKIECDWTEAGRVVLARSDKKLRQAERAARGISEFLDTEVENISATELRNWFDSDFYTGGVFVSRSGSLNPGKLVDGLITRLRQSDSAIFESCPVERMEVDDYGVRVYSAAGEHRARRVIIAANGHMDCASSPISAYALPIASNIISLEQAETTPASRWPAGITFSESRRVLCYFRRDPDGTRLLFGGRASFLPIPTEKAAERLFKFASQRIGYTRRLTIANQWQGYVAFTADGLPKLLSDKYFISLGGCNGSGIAAMILLGRRAADMIRGRSVSLPSRIRYSQRFLGKSLVPIGLPIVGGAFRLLDWVDDQFTGRRGG